MIDSNVISIRKIHTILVSLFIIKPVFFQKSVCYIFLG